MINQMPNSNVVELTRFGAMQIIMNIEVGIKAFLELKKVCGSRVNQILRSLLMY